MMSERVGRDEILRVLAAHRFVINYGNPVCSCGLPCTPRYDASTAECRKVHDAHVAALLADACDDLDARSSDGQVGVQPVSQDDSETRESGQVQARVHVTHADADEYARIWNLGYAEAHEQIAAIVGDRHDRDCAVYMPHPTGTDPECDCWIGELRAAIRADAVPLPAGHQLQREALGVGWSCAGCSWMFSYDVDLARAEEVWGLDRRHRSIVAEQGEA